jgi:hypothetical protein
MTTYITFDATLDGSNNTEQDAIDYARGMVWCELETTEDTISYANHIDTIDGVGVYYDFGADYYFFTDEA